MQSCRQNGLRYFSMCAHMARELGLRQIKCGIGPAAVSAIVRNVAAVVCRLLPSLVAFSPFRLSASHFASDHTYRECIDGSHISTAKPIYHGTMFFNRQCWYSIVLQAVVDWRGSFYDLDCKRPGRAGDSRVFRNSNPVQCFPTISAEAENMSILLVLIRTPASRTSC